MLRSELEKYVARNQAHAAELIDGWVIECREGVSDRGSQAETMAALWLLDVPETNVRFAEARRLWNAKQAAEPKVALAEAEPKPDEKPKWRLKRFGESKREEPPHGGFKETVDQPRIEEAAQPNLHAAKPQTKPPELLTGEALGVPYRTWDEVRVPAGANDLEALTYVPGLVGDIVEWIYSGAIRPNRMMALGTAITVVGTLIGRYAQGPTGTATHLYVVILGKDWPLHAARVLLKAIGARDLIGTSGFASAPGLWKLLEKQPLRLCLVDEMGDELSKINQQGGNPFVTKSSGR
jgi:hypothetical protein